MTHFFATFREEGDAQWGAVGTFDVSSGLSFGTQLNGGYAGASMQVNLPQRQSSWFARTVLGSEVTIYDDLGRYVYNGRVSGVNTISDGVGVTASGFWGDGSKITVPTALWLDPATTNGLVIYEASALVPSWSPALGATYLNVPVGAQEYDDEVKVADLITEMLKVGYRTDSVVPVHIALYANQIPRMIVEDKPVYINYYVEADTDKGASGSTISIDDVYNEIYALYDDPATDSVGPTMYPSPVSDLASQSKYGKRQGIINTGEYGLGIAQDLLGLANIKYAWPTEQFPIEVSSYVRNSNGAYEPPYVIKAGDWLSITNLDEVSVLKSFDPERVDGFVTGTSYSSDSASIRITMGSGDKNLEYMLARLGLSGGLS